MIGIDASDAVLVRAKTGWALRIFEAVIACSRRRAIPDAPLKALIIDSWFDNYVGVVMLVRVVDGVLRPGQICFMATGAQHPVRAGWRVLAFKSVQRRNCVPGGGLRHFGIKELKAAKVGDTITTGPQSRRNRCRVSREIKPQVFAGLYPVEIKPGTTSLRESLENSNSTTPRCTEPEVSQALGFGFPLRLLGLLHMESCRKRLEREFDQDLITTAPTVVYGC